MMNILRRPFCKHIGREFVRNLDGDEMFRHTTPKCVAVSEWKCTRCGKTIYMDILIADTKLIEHPRSAREALTKGESR